MEICRLESQRPFLVMLLRSSTRCCIFKSFIIVVFDSKKKFIIGIYLSRNLSYEKLFLHFWFMYHCPILCCVIFAYAYFPFSCRNGPSCTVIRKEKEKIGAPKATKKIKTQNFLRKFGQSFLLM